MTALKVRHPFWITRHFTFQTYASGPNFFQKNMACFRSVPGVKNGASGFSGLLKKGWQVDG
jgi:hypothetical protein